MSVLYVASNYINYTGSYGHLQFVYDAEDGTGLFEAEVQAPTLIAGNWQYFYDVDHTTTSNYQQVDRYYIQEVTLGEGQSAEYVWGLIGQIVNSMRLTGVDLDYHGFQNSNSFANTVSYVLGLDTDWSTALLGGDIDSFPGYARNVLLEAELGWSNTTGIALNLSGTAGNDIINTGNGDDTLGGAAGNDVISSFAGNDVINGGTGNDILDGGLGNDTIIGGDDVGGRDIDTAVFTGNRSEYVWQLQANNDIIILHVETGEEDTIRGIERLQFADTITDQFMQPLGRIALISGLGGDAGFGENLLARNDDGSTVEIDITSIFGAEGLNFFGREFTSLWVNNNGSVTFNGSRGTYTPSDITANNNNPEITPFFADVDTRGGATTASPGGNSTGSNLVYYDFDVANDRFIVTWDDVGYYSSQTNLTNAFQLILTDRHNGDFDIEFRYENVDWTTGNASGGVNGLGGIVARAGYTASTGDPDAYFELPVSGDQADILALDDTEGNRGQVGRWEFNVRSGEVVTTDIPALPDNGISGWTTGDPHLLTLDGVAYDFHAAGEYVLLRATNGSDFEVQSRMTPVGDSVSVNAAIATTMGGTSVMVDATDASPISVDGTVRAIDDFGFIDVGNDRIYRTDNVYTLIYAGDDGIVNGGDSRIIVTVHDGRIDLDVRLNSDLAGNLEGLLGNADGDASNDVALADGTPLDRPLRFEDLYGQYRDDWRVTENADSLFSYDDGESLSGFYLPDYPGALVTIGDFTAAEVDAAVVAATNAGLTVGTANFNNAVLDFVLTEDATFIESATNVGIITETAAPEVISVGGVTLTGDALANFLEGGAFSDTLRGGGGNDHLIGGARSDHLYGGDGADTLNGGSGDDFIFGGDTSADLRDVMYGGDGNDTMDGGYGNDELRGDAGDDTMAGGFGADTLIGGAGNDVMTGSAFGDLLFGGDGMDFVNGGWGHDRVNGGADADRFFHVGIFDHGSDWIQDYDATEGDVLLFGNASAGVDDFQVNFAHTATPEGERSGDDNVEEAFVIYRPTGQIMWALVDGGGQGSINIVIDGVEYDLLG